MRLFQIPFSHNCVKVRRVLDLKGLDYETVNINPALRRDVKRASGQELVPVLVDGGHATRRLDADPARRRGSAIPIHRCCRPTSASAPSAWC